MEGARSTGSLAICYQDLGVRFSQIFLNPVLANVFARTQFLNSLRI